MIASVLLDRDTSNICNLIKVEKIKKIPWRHGPICYTRWLVDLLTIKRVYLFKVDLFVYKKIFKEEKGNQIYRREVPLRFGI